MITWDVLQTPQKPTSGHCSCRAHAVTIVFFQNSGGHELTGLVPWPFQPCQISVRWGDSPTKGTPFSLKNLKSHEWHFFLVFKEVRTEEFAKTLKVCFLWLFVLTAVCCSKLEFWVQEVILIFVGFAFSILSPFILEGPTGPWQQTHSKHDDAFPVFLVNNCYHKDAAWFPLKKSSLKTDWIFNYSRGNYGLLRYLGSKQLGHHQNLKIWPLWHWNLRRSPCVACWLGRPVIFNDFKTRDFWNDHPRIDIFRYLGTGELVWNSMKFTLQRVVYKKPRRFRGEFQAKRVSLCRC